jgi:hypothetical protein
MAVGPDIHRLRAGYSSLSMGVCISRPQVFWGQKRGDQFLFAGLRGKKVLKSNV